MAKVEGDPEALSRQLALAPLQDDAVHLGSGKLPTATPLTTKRSAGKHGLVAGKCQGWGNNQ